MANREEKQSLLGAFDESGNYGVPKLPPETAESPTTPENGSDQESKKKRGSAGKRGHLQRNPSLEKVDEDLEKEEKQSKESESKFGCGDYFGVKSYLHHFYETHQYKDPDLYEEEGDDYRYLLHPYPRRRRCTSIWWKVFVWIGANFLIFGIIGVLVGYLVPQRPVMTEGLTDNLRIVDHEAISFNFNLDVCKLVGLILFCIGGLTLTVALLFPSFLYPYCDDDRKDGSFKVSMAEELPPKSPLEMSIPASSKVKSVQPDRKEESVVTQGGMVSMHE